MKVAFLAIFAAAAFAPVAIAAQSTSPLPGAAPMPANKINTPLAISSKPQKGAVGGGVRLAQACGWYAISVCSRGRRGARRGANRYGGYVIDTSSEAYPNFRPGWYCSVVGPTSRGQAHRIAAEMRYSGARTAYVKNGC